MKFLFNDNVFGWKMTGLAGKFNNWFFGFSFNTNENGWISTKKRMPINDQRILYIVNNKIYLGTYVDSETENYFISDNTIQHATIDVTHFLPISNLLN